MKKTIWTKELQKIFPKDPGKILIIAYSFVIMLFIIAGLLLQSF